MKIFVILLILSLSASSSLAEMRVWTLNDGTSFEAEFIYWNQGKVILKPKKGKDLNIPASRFSDKEISYIELESPPKFEFNFAKTTKRRNYPDTYNGGVNADTFITVFKMQMKTRSFKPYRHPLEVEFFVLGEEVHGGQHMLVHYQKQSVHMEDLEKGELEMSSDPIQLTEYVQNGYKQGERYGGHLIMVTDSRGEVIAHTATRDYWLEHIENLRKVPLGKIFDQSCNRCMPTRAKKWY